MTTEARTLHAPPARGPVPAPAPPAPQTPPAPPAPHAPTTRYEELARQLTGIGAVKRDLARLLPPDCPPGSAAVLTLLDRHGEIRLSRLADLMAIDISVTSRHVAYVADRGWITRDIDPGDGRCRILRLTPAGHALLAEVGARYTGALEKALADWSPHDIDVLNTLLTRLRSSF